LFGGHFLVLRGGDTYQQQDCCKRWPESACHFNGIVD
jgi:hypothetical protein